MLGILEELGGFGSPDRTVIFNVLSSREGLERVLRRDLEVYTCGVDDKLDDRGYIVPGLGDAGDLAFGRPSECRK